MFYEFCKFLWKRKLWWLAPIFLVIFLLSTIIILTQGSVLAPFIYTLF